MLHTEFAAQSAKQYDDPKEKANGQQYLPETAQVQVLETLTAKPGPQMRQPPVDPDELTDQAAEDHNRQRNKQGIGKPVLTSWLSTCDHRGEKDSSCQKASGHPKNSELKMPSSGDVERDHPCKVNAEEVGYVGAIMLARSTEESLKEKKHSHYQKKPSASTLRWSERDLVWGTKRNSVSFTSMPTKKIPAPECGKQQANSAK